MSRISVVVPSYNHGPFVEEAVGSVLGGGGGELEVVVVDDGSSDDTMVRLAGVAARDPRLRVISQENRGAHAALNRALALATGEVVLILDSDDLFEPERVSRLSELLLADRSVAVAASWLRVVDRDGRSLGVKRGFANMPPWPPPCPGPRLIETGSPELALLEANYVATTSNMAFRRSLVEESGLRFLPLRYCHDWEFLLAATAHGRLAMVEEPLVRYRVHPSNTIAEGTSGGQGAMRFEVMWTVTRHAEAVCRRHAGGEVPSELLARLWRSLPRFGCDDLLADLLVLRGSSVEPPAEFDALVAPGHPFREAAVAELERLA